MEFAHVWIRSRFVPCLRFRRNSVLCFCLCLGTLSVGCPTVIMAWISYGQVESFGLDTSIHRYASLLWSIYHSELTVSSSLAKNPSGHVLCMFCSSPHTFTEGINLPHCHHVHHSPSACMCGEIGRHSKHSRCGKRLGMPTFCTFGVVVLTEESRSLLYRIVWKFPSKVRALSIDLNGVERGTDAFTYRLECIDETDRPFLQASRPCRYIAYR